MTKALAINQPLEFTSECTKVGSKKTAMYSVTVPQTPAANAQLPNCPTVMVAGRPKHFENSSDDLNDPRGKRFSNHPVGGITTILAINGEIFEIPKKIDQTLGHFHAFAYCKRFLHHSRGLD